MTHDMNWYWSQRGTTMGPVDLAELRRLAIAGSIMRSTWVFGPAQASWVSAESVEGIFERVVSGSTGTPTPIPAPDFDDGPAFAPAHPTPRSTATTASGASPPIPESTPNSTPNSVSGSVPGYEPSLDSTEPASRFCRFCGSVHEPFAKRCPACGQSFAVTPFKLEPRIAEIICRSAVLLAPIINVASFVVVGLVWGFGAADARIVAEARETMNCLLTLALVFVIAAILGVTLAIILIGPVLAAIITVALICYCIVIGIIGIIAATTERPFKYWWSIAFIR